MYLNFRLNACAAGLSYINFIYILQHKNLYLGLVKWTKNMYYNQVV